MNGSPTSEEKNWAMAAHGAPIVALIVTAGTLSWLVPLIIWLVKQDDSPYVTVQAKEALNFQITVFFINIACLIMIFTVFLACVAIPLLVVVAVAQIVLALIATLAVSRGDSYRYPMTLRLIS